VTITVLSQFAESGSITDVALGLRWDRADFATEVRKRASNLAAAGVKPSSTVALAHSGSAFFLADLFAVWTLGCTAACIDPALTQSEVETLVQFVEPAGVLVGDASINARVSAPILNLTGFESTTSPFAVSDNPERAALILFTSGTTGRPKGVVLSFHALLSRMALNKAAMGQASRANTLITLPTSFGHGLIGNTLTPLLSGGDIVFYPPGLSLAQNLGSIIDRYQIGFLSSVPAFWRMALKFSDAPSKGTLVRVHVGSAPLSADLWTQIGEWSRADVVNCYGVTELANWVSGASQRSGPIADGLVGTPWGGKAAIRDNAGTIRDAGEGELLIKSPCVMSGYLRRPDLTAAVFIDDWYRTGDIGHIDEIGAITLTGRIKEEINRAGFKVQPAEIEALLETHVAVADVCVFGVSDSVSGEIVAAAICLAPGENTNGEDLQRWCAERLRREAVPEKWFFVEQLPRNERGKINRDALRTTLVKDPK
jgi:oxalate---CoA ligase